MFDLNKLLSPSASNISLVDAFAINNSGDIVAEGFIQGQQWPQLQLFYLTPDGQPVPLSPDPLIQTFPETPEPSTLAIFGLSIAGVAAHRWRSRAGSRQKSVVS